MWLLPDGRVVVVLISHGGVTRDKILRPHRPFSQQELDRIAEFLNQHYAGWTLEAIRGDLLQKLANERERYEGIVQSALTLCDPAVLGEDNALRVHVEGTAQMIGATEFADQAQLRDLLAAIEEKHRLVTVLNACIDTPEPVFVKDRSEGNFGGGRKPGVDQRALHEQRPGAGFAGRAGAHAHALRAGHDRGGVRGAALQ